jgi:hypothetical protein
VIDVLEKLIDIGTDEGSLSDTMGNVYPLVGVYNLLHGLF